MEGSAELLGGGNIEEREISTEMRAAYLDYAMSVIVGRALPDVRDGLKPVHRRVLYAMHDLGLQPNRPYRKSAFIVGEVMGKYHPHGDQSIYDTLVRMAQDFSLRGTLVDGQGNFGSIDDDPPAAMRYCVTADTRVRMAGGSVRIGDLARGVDPDSDTDVDLTVLDRLGRPVRASKLFHSGAHPTLRMKTREGFELTGSENHPVLCLVSVAGVPMPLWKRLDEIASGDRVLVNRTPRPEEQKRTASIETELMGFGSSADRIPEAIWRGPTALKRSFISELLNLEADGPSVWFANHGLAHDLQLLLLEFGHVGRLTREGDGWAVTVHPEDQSVDVPGLERFRREELELVGAGFTQTAVETETVVEPLLTGDYFYAEVDSVVPAGVQDVYSLRVDTDDHSFLTNGIVSHNTEARLARLATEMLRDIEAETVDFGPNYDESSSEPLVLPSRFPNLLVNGSSGIAVGMATNIPPHNLGEVISAVNAYLEDPEIDTEGLMKYVKGPDFPGGGIIMGSDGIKSAYRSGRGSVRVRAKAHIEPIKGGKEAIIVSELPFMVRKGGDGGLITKIAALVRDKKITEISDLRDESDRSGMRLVIELKRDAIPKVALNKLYKHTTMQSTFGVNMVALVDGVPRTLSLKEMVSHYVGHQREVVIRRTQFHLRQAEARAHVLEGILVALDNLDAVIALIRGSASPDEARAGLMSEFSLTEIQAQAILDMRLQRLTALESDKVREEHAELLERIRELREILGDEKRIDAVISEELAEIGERYGDPRRTEITFAEGEVDIEDMIADQQMVISLTASGYAKRLPLATYRQQHRGGKGVTGMDLKEGDYIEHLHICSTHDYLLFFTNKGKVYRLKVYELPEGSRTARGKALVNVLPLSDGERVMTVIPTRDFSEGKYLAFATAGGLIKKTEFIKYNTPIRADGIIAINVREGDELVQVRLTSGDDDILMVSRSGKASRFNESAVRPMGRDTSGVRGMNVSDTVDGEPNRVLAMDIARPDTELFVVTENGYGKRTPIDEYPVKGRGTKGNLTAKLTAKKGGLAGAMIVREHQDLLFISVNGMVQRTSVKGISSMGRATQGVRVMNVKEGDRVSAVALVVEEDSSVEDVAEEAELPIDAPTEPEASADGAAPASPDGSADDADAGEAG